MSHVVDANRNISGDWSDSDADSWNSDSEETHDVKPKISLVKHCHLEEPPSDQINNNQVSPVTEINQDLNSDWNSDDDVIKSNTTNPVTSTNQDSSAESDWDSDNDVTENDRTCPVTSTNQDSSAESNWDSEDDVIETSQPSGEKGQICPKTLTNQDSSAESDWDSEDDAENSLPSRDDIIDISHSSVHDAVQKCSLSGVDVIENKRSSVDVIEHCSVSEDDVIESCRSSDDTVIEDCILSKNSVGDTCRSLRNDVIESCRSSTNYILESFKNRRVSAADQDSSAESDWDSEYDVIDSPPSGNKVIENEPSLEDDAIGHCRDDVIEKHRSTGDDNKENYYWEYDVISNDCDVINVNSDNLNDVETTDAETRPGRVPSNTNTLETSGNSCRDTTIHDSRDTDDVHVGVGADLDDILLEDSIAKSVYGEQGWKELQNALSEEDIRVKSFLESTHYVTTDVITTIPRPLPSKFAALTMNLSFAGCGFLGIYHLGVAHALSRHGRKLLLNVQKFGGASAGSLVASALAVKGPDKRVIDECIEFCYQLAETTRGRRMGVLNPRVTLLDPLQQFLEHMLPEDAHIIARNRLFVSVTCARTKKNSLHCEFESKAHLIQFLLGSSNVPRVTGKGPVRIGGEKYVDGGMTDNMPEIPDGRTILVTPFSGRQHICPLDKSGRGRYVNINGEAFQVTVNNIKRGIHAFFPPKRAHMARYLQRGKLDCIRFLKKEHYYEEEEHYDDDEHAAYICGDSPNTPRGNSLAGDTPMS